MFNFLTFNHNYMEKHDPKCVLKMLSILYGLFYCDLKNNIALIVNVSVERMFGRENAKS